MEKWWNRWDAELWRQHKGTNIWDFEFKVILWRKGGREIILKDNMAKPTDALTTEIQRDQESTADWNIPRLPHAYNKVLEWYGKWYS